MSRLVQQRHAKVVQDALAPLVLAEAEDFSGRKYCTV